VTTTTSYTPNALGSVALLVLLSGCASSEAGPAAAPASSSTGLSGDEAAFDDTSGAITGSVLTDELMPAHNAEVGILETGLRLRTTDAGRFAFSHVKPGDYRIQASALGFKSDIKKVTVVAGAAVEARFQLRAGAVDGPYHETEIHKGMVRSVTWRIGDRCDTIVQPPIGTCLGIQFQDVTFYYDSDPTWATYVDEAQWTPNSAVFHQRAYVFSDFPNVTDFSGVPDFKSPGHFETSGKSPVVLRIERTTVQARHVADGSQYGRTRFRAVNNFDDVNATVVGVSLMLDQPMSVYLSVFYKDPAPLGFTALPDR
jgi:hypothetical protein